ncbi:uncharacterized protein LOC123894847 [Trifolium pratense]|uniref:uncharacterized protein LOC123894847 n=1 Tax=Trifolium pratense TaxID=57577 RepID=UPI001E6970B0|nr:uncharacterized protein LOC123894847 [Trifolium pratense]
MKRNQVSTRENPKEETQDMSQISTLTETHISSQHLGCSENIQDIDVKDPVRDLTAALKYLVENRSLSSEEAQFACQHFNFEVGKTEVEMWLTFNEVTKVRYVKHFFSVRDKVKNCDHHWMPPRGCQGRQQRSSRTI